jgi:glycine cleavage system protein P-like pyridoxal-binding family
LESDRSILPEKLKEFLTPKIAAGMLTFANTLGAFEKIYTRYQE